MKRTRPEPQSRDLPVADILPSTFGSREADDGLVQSVKESGILHPVGVVPDGDRFRLVFGARRLDAAKRAGLKSIPARVFPAGTDPITARVWFLAENIQRLAADPLGEASTIAELCSTTPVEEAARRLGRSPSWVRQRLILAALPVQAQDLLRGTDFSPSAVAILARLPPGPLMRTLEENALARSSVFAAQDALRAAGQALDRAPFDASACAPCERRTEGWDGAPLCLDGECFASKSVAAVGQGIAAARREHSTAPVVVSKSALDSASPDALSIYRAHGATTPPHGMRIAEDDGKTDGKAAVCVDGGRVRVVRLVADPTANPPDGRALRHGEDGKQSIALRKALTAVLDAPPQDIQPDALPALVVALAGALDGKDGLSLGGAVHVLLRHAGPVIRERLLHPTDATDRAGDFRRVRALLAML